MFPYPFSRCNKHKHHIYIFKIAEISAKYLESSVQLHIVEQFMKTQEKQ